MPVESFNGYRRNDDYLRDVARGGVVGARPFGAFGETITAGAASGVIWPNGTYRFLPEAGVQLSLQSDSANDAAAGTGVRVVDVHGLDANLNEVEEEVTLNGLTPALTTRTNWRFVQCTHAKSWGSGLVAAGTITVNYSGNPYSEIAAGAVRCSSSVRMVPKGKRLLVTSFFGGGVSGSAGAKVQVYMATPTFEEHNFISSGVFFPLAAAAFQDDSSGLTIPCPLAFTEGQVIGMTYKTDKAATINGSWFGCMENA